MYIEGKLTKPYRKHCALNTSLYCDGIALTTYERGRVRSDDNFEVLHFAIGMHYINDTIKSFLLYYAFIIKETRILYQTFRNFMQGQPVVLRVSGESESHNIFISCL